jgi:hypothetical protein
LIAAGVQTAFFCLMPVLHGDHQAFEGAQNAARKHYGQRQPKDQVEPNGWLKRQFDEEHKPTTMTKPTSMITNTAGPSPLSAKE